MYIHSAMFFVVFLLLFPHPPPHNSFYTENLVSLRLLVRLLLTQGIRLMIGCRRIDFSCGAPKGRLLFPIMGGGNGYNDAHLSPWNIFKNSYILFTHKLHTLTHTQQKKTHINRVRRDRKFHRRE